MAIYNAVYVNQNQINVDAGADGFLSLGNNGTYYTFTPSGGESVNGTITYTSENGDGIYTLSDHQGFFRSAGDLPVTDTNGTWTFEGTLPLVPSIIESPNSNIAGYDPNVAANAFIKDQNGNAVEISKIIGITGSGVTTNSDGVVNVETFDTNDASLTGTTNMESAEVQNLTVNGAVNLGNLVFDSISEANANAPQGVIFYVKK